jgi:NADH-quinone oxidoreductase subunit M
MMASIGLPGLSGFVSEFLILVGTFATHAWWGAVCRDRGHRRGGLSALGLPAGLPRSGDWPNATIPDATMSERWVLVPVVVLLVALGVFPHPLLDQITPSIQQLLHHVAAVTK